jgi:shikimate kinase
MIRIFLIGYMGAGKTTLGKLLAKDLGVEFIDLDWYIEARFHKTVSEIFAERGEAGFREMERNMLHEVGAFDNVIISAGGGTPCFFDNMDFMNANGQTVFLDAGIDVLFSRLRVAKQQRPILRDKNDEELKTFIGKALEGRMPFYSKATYRFCADELESNSQIDNSVKRLRELLGL